MLSSPNRFFANLYDYTRYWGDGIWFDNCNTQQLDADGDGIGDVCDDPNDDGCGGEGGLCGGSEPDCEIEC
jgi:hypothetical protein